MSGKAKAVFVGSCERFLDGKRIEDYIEENDVADLVELTGHLSRKASLEYQMNATILLMIVGIVPKEMELTYGLSGKVFDYLLFGKPILTIANGGSTREFVVEHRIGSVFYHHDVEGIKQYLVASYLDFEKGLPLKARSLNEFGEFNFKTITAALSQHMEHLLRK